MKGYHFWIISKAALYKVTYKRLILQEGLSILSELGQAILKDISYVYSLNPFFIKGMFIYFYDYQKVYQSYHATFEDS
jgi:hypothetical protein